MNAKLIQDVLNGHGLVFRITDERIKQTTYEKSNDVVGVLETMPGGYLYNEVGNRILTMQIEFAGANKDFESFREIVKDYFPNDELIGDTWIYSQPLEFTDFADNEGHKKFNARIVFQVVEVVGGVSGKSTTIKVDGVEIDFTNVLYRQDKSLLPTKAFGLNKEVRMVSELLSIKIPMSDNTKNIELIMAGADNSYNKSYLVEWNIGGIKKTFYAVMRVGISEYSKTYEPLLWTLTFERALPREEWGVAFFHEGHYWEITRTPKPYNIAIDEDFDTEQEFRDYLEANFDVGEGTRTIRAGTGSDLKQNWEILEGTPSKTKIYVYDNNDTYDRSGFDLETFEYLLSLYHIESVGFTYMIETEDFDNYEVVIVGNENSGYEPGGPITPIGTINGDGTESRVIELLNSLYPDPYEIYGVCSVIDTFDGNIWYFVGNAIKRYWFARVTSIEGNYWFATAKEGNKYSSPIIAPVIDYSAKHSVETTTRWKDGKVIGDPAFYGNGFVVLFLITEATQQFIDDLYEQAGAHYKITFKINNKTYNYEDLIITDIERQNSENASQVMQVTFAEGGRL